MDKLAAGQRSGMKRDVSSGPVQPANASGVK